MSSLNFLISELQALATETRRRYPDVREAADKAVAFLRANAATEAGNLAADGPHQDDLLKPVFLGCATKNAKVVAIALGTLQRLIALRAIPLRAIPHILSTMGEIIGQGVDIQLRILQALLSLVTNFSEIHGTALGDALLLCFRLQDSRIAVVSSTAAATLRQLVMYIFEKVLNDKAPSSPENLHTTKLPDGSTASLKSSELDAYRVFEDLCLLANQERPNFLRLESLPKTFSLELIESVLTNYHVLFHKRPEILLLLHHHLSPLLLKSLSERPTFPLTLRSTRVVFILLKHFSGELETESEVFAMMLIKMISGEETHTMDGSRRPQWMRVLAAEVIRGICGDADLMRQYFEHYDDEGGSHVFTSLITALKRLVTEKPALLGVGQQMQGLGVQQDGQSNYKLENVAGMVASAASTTVSGALGIQSNVAGLSMATCTMKVQCIDQLDKTDAPPIPEGYIFVLGLQCLVSIAEGFAANALPAFASLTPKNANINTRLPAALDLSTLSPEDPIVHQLLIEQKMIESAWPALLAALSFLMGTNLSDELFAEVLAALQAMTNVSGVLGLQTPRDAFLTSLSKLAIPARVVTKLDGWVEPATPRGGSGMGTAMVDGLAALAGHGSSSANTQMPALSERNMACLKVLIYTASYLGGSLGEAWFSILETLQNADYVLTGKGTKRRVQSNFVVTPPSRAISGSTSGTSGVDNSSNAQPDRPLLLMDVEPEHVLAAIQGLFESTKDMEDSAFHDFTVALCRLSAEMIGMQVSNELEESAEEVNGNGVPASPTVAVAHAHRRRVSGIQLTRTPRSGDFGVTKLGMIALLNINRLVYANGEIAWSPITSHLVTVLRHPMAPSSVRLQAAQNLDNFLVIIPRSLSNLSKELVEEVQQRTLNVLAMQVLTEGGAPTVMDIRRMGLETLHQILQTGSHTIIVGWEVILEMLASVCKPISSAPMSIPLHSQDSLPSTPLTATPQTRPTPLLVTSFNERPNLSLIRIAFQSLTLVCESLLSLSVEQLKLCISTLGLFGRQTDTNIALTAAESLLWGVSDSIQLRRKDPAMESQYSDLWMFLLSELLVLCTDARPEVRGGSIQTLFRTMQLYGTTLSLETWDKCMWQIAFPLLEALKHGAAMVSPDADDAASSIGAWDESKTLALQSIGSVFNDFLMSKLVLLEDFEKIWNAFAEHIQDVVLHDNKAIGTVALRALEKALRAFKDPSGTNRTIADRSCERTWIAWETIGTTIGPPSPTAFTQDCLVALVDTVKALRALSKSVRGHEWQLERLKSLMSILKTIMTYAFSPDYRPDIDALTPLQGNILAVFDSVDLLVPGSPSLLLTDLSYFATLAFFGEAQPVPTSPRPDTRTKPKALTYIALCKRAMPLLAHMFSRFKASADIYADGTVEAILAAYSIPIKLKYDCPAPSKFGSDLPLWKMATTNFLTVAKECAPRVAGFNDSPDESVARVWRKLLEVFEGALLADCSSAADDPIDETFDYVFITTIETHIAPHLGHARIPDDIVSEFGKVLQHASKIHDIRSSPLHLTRSSSTQTLVEPPNIQSLLKPTKGFGKNELEEVIGTTIPATILPRERFSYWCFDLLFLMCSRHTQDHEDNRRRVAALCLPNLLSRISQVLRSYCLDTGLYGDMPFSRAREEELIYVLRKMLSSKLWTGSLWASESDNPSKFAQQQPEPQMANPANMIKDLAYRSERAHLFYCYNLLLQIASTAKPASAWLPDSHLGVEGLSGSSQNESPQILHFNSKELATSCLQILGEEMGFSA